MYVASVTYHFFFISSTIFTLTLSRHCKSADLMALAAQSKGKNVVAEEQINVVDWPRQSQNLNPTENIGKVIDQCLQTPKIMKNLGN